MWERRTTFYAAAHAAVYTSPIPLKSQNARGSNEFQADSGGHVADFA